MVCCFVLDKMAVKTLATKTFQGRSERRRGIA
jgi:hypothetical protein